MAGAETIAAEFGDWETWFRTGSSRSIETGSRNVPCGSDRKICVCPGWKKFTETRLGDAIRRRRRESGNAARRFIEDVARFRGRTAAPFPHRMIVRNHMALDVA